MTALRISALLAVVMASCTGGGIPAEPARSPEARATGSPVPAGDWWAGEIHAMSTLESADGSTACTEVWDVDLDLHDNEGQVTGSGDGDLLAQRNCESDDPAFDLKAQAKHFEFNLRGRLSERGFVIELILVRSNGEFLGRLDQSLFYEGAGQKPQSLEVPITQPGIAQAKLAILEEVPEGTVTGSHRFLFACQQC